MNAIHRMLQQTSNHEVMSEEYLVEPDQTLSIRQLLERYAKGLPVGVSQRDPVYQEDVDFTDVREFDFTEVDEMIAEQKAKQEEKRQILKDIENEIQRRKNQKQEPEPGE